MKSTGILLLALVFLFSFTHPIHADIAPPEQPPGANLEPGNQTTQVRMVSETVLIDVQKAAPQSSLGQAKVTAEFVMQNLGSSTENMAVRFPISASDGRFNYPEIAGFIAKVDGRTVTTRKISSQENDALKWAEFDVTFKPAVDVIIEVGYTLEGSGEYPFISFAYLLGTGAGWQGTIGSADVTVRLPYEANNLNVFIDSGPGWGDTTAGAVMEGTDMRWQYSDFEPGEWDNVQVAMVMPSAWQKVLTERANVDKNPRDGEAWGRLAKVYKEISRLRRETRWDAGGPLLFELSRDAYERALELLPDDALWHAGYAELLFDNYYWIELQHPQKPGLLQALHELSLAVQLKPNEPFIRDLLDEVRWALPEGVQVDESGQATFLWLTATPTFFPTHTPFPTETPVLPSAASTLHPTVTVNPPTETSVLPTAVVTSAAAAAGPSPTKSAGSSFPLCPAAVILPLAVVFFTWQRRKNPLEN